MITKKLIYLVIGIEFMHIIIMAVNQGLPSDSMLLMIYPSLFLALTLQLKMHHLRYKMLLSKVIKTYYFHWLLLFLPIIFGVCVTLIFSNHFPVTHVQKALFQLGLKACIVLFNAVLFGAYFMKKEKILFVISIMVLAMSSMNMIKISLSEIFSYHVVFKHEPEIRTIFSSSLNGTFWFNVLIVVIVMVFCGKYLYKIRLYYRKRKINL